MVAEALAPLSLTRTTPTAFESVLACSPAQLRLATSAVYVAELALVAPDEAAGGVPPVVVAESGEHPDHVADVADRVLAAGLGLVRLLQPALQVQRDGGRAEHQRDDDDECTQELVVTTASKVHFVHILAGVPQPRVVYLVFERHRGTVVHARHFLRRHLAAGAADRPRSAPAPQRRAAVVPITRRHLVGPADRAAERVAPVAHGRAPTVLRQRWACDERTLERVLAGLRRLP